MLKCLEDGFACVFSLLSIILKLNTTQELLSIILKLNTTQELLSIILKLNTTQEAYPVQKGLFIDSYPTVTIHGRLCIAHSCYKYIRVFTHSFDLTAHYRLSLAPSST